MTVDNLIKQIRTAINDVEELEFSDNELLMYINDSLDYICEILADNQSSINLVILDIIATSTVIPNDLLRINKVGNGITNYKQIYNVDKVGSLEYSLLGNELIVSTIPCKLYYFKRLEHLALEENIDDMYSPIFPFIVEYSVIKAQSRLEYNLQLEEQKLQLLKDKVAKMISRRSGLPLITRYDGFLGGR